MESEWRPESLAIARQMKKRGTMDAALRLGIRGGGCSGFSYVIEFHDGAPHAELPPPPREMSWSERLRAHASDAGPINLR